MMTFLRNIKKEYLYFTILGFLILLLKAFDKEDPQIHFAEIFIVTFYLGVATFINYVLIPRYFNQGRIKTFVSLFLITLVLVVVLEEFVLEKIFYSDSRGEVIYISGAFIEIVPVFIILLGYKLIWDSYEKQNKIEQLKRLVAESELQNINSQISPHFLFNNLNTLYSYSIEHSKKTPQLILQLSGILRYMLYDCKEKLVPLNREIENLKNYIELNNIQLGARAKINYQLPEVDENIRISPLILIVFVENAIKHSSTSQAESIEIDIQLKLREKELYFICKNTFSEESVENGLKGIGLDNVRSRLNIVYENRHELCITKKHNIYHVSLNIDLSDD